MQLNTESHEFDVCVIGGGMAGMCAAIAAARSGARTALVQDRAVLGGNASSEIRMWICGAHGAHNKETGILEEIQLDNLYHNPSLNYSQWDGVLYGKVRFQPKLTTFFNCSCADATMDGDRIVGIKAWQLTTQTWHTILARQFVDCSGDSILAALTPAAFRVGREARDEFGEDIEPRQADAKTMGNSLLIQMRRADEAHPFTPPRWAYKFQAPDDLPHRIQGVKADNFWWLEIGGLNDTIKDAEEIRDELMKIGYGVWDYIKNHAPERAAAENWQIEWIGSLPGKRESRRYVGDHILTQNDIRAGGEFDDLIAYGGWSMDDHHPAGLLYPGSPTIFHPAPSPYGIPYRCLYSRNVASLLFAGRNISVTHAALSSTRVMATCALLGQAAGTAAALAIRRRCDPRALSRGAALREMQQILMEDDCWLPGRRREPTGLAASAHLSSDAPDSELVRDGLDRDREHKTHAWSGRTGGHLEYRWEDAVFIGGARFVFDINLSNDKRMPYVYPQRGGHHRVPKTLVKAFRIEALGSSGDWTTAYREMESYQRLVRVPLNVRTKAIRFIPEKTWGDEAVRVFGFEPTELHDDRIPVPPDGIAYSIVRARCDPADLAPPESARDGSAGRGIPA